MPIDHSSWPDRCVPLAWVSVPEMHARTALHRTSTSRAGNRRALLLPIAGELIAGLCMRGVFAASTKGSEAFGPHLHNWLNPGSRAKETTVPLQRADTALRARSRTCLFMKFTTRVFSSTYASVSTVPWPCSP
jgi:hypothetical protein